MFIQGSHDFGKVVICLYEFMYNILSMFLHCQVAFSNRLTFNLTLLIGIFPTLWTICSVSLPVKELIKNLWPIFVILSIL